MRTSGASRPSARRATRRSRKTSPGRNGARAGALAAGGGVAWGARTGPRRCAPGIAGEMGAVAVIGLGRLVVRASPRARGTGKGAGLPAAGRRAPAAAGRCGGRAGRRSPHVRGTDFTPIGRCRGRPGRGRFSDDSIPEEGNAVAQETYVGQDRSTYIEEDRGSGWITFAGVVIIMVAILNIIDGIAAISKSAFFTNNARFVFSDLRTWGWIVLALGALQVLVAFGVWAGNSLARWTGIVIVSLNAIAQLLFIPAYPFWSLSIFALDVLVLYGLAAHGGRPALD